jgi:hypothetical protein
MKLFSHALDGIKTHFKLFSCVLLVVTQFVYWQSITPQHLVQLTKESGVSIRNETLVNASENAFAALSLTNSMENHDAAKHVTLSARTQQPGDISVDAVMGTSAAIEESRIKGPEHAKSAPTLSHSTASFPLPRVVILPGPHKAGSTSLQQCMVDWTFYPDRWKDILEQHGQKRERWNRVQQRRKKRGKPFEEQLPPELAQDPVMEPLVLPRWSWPAPLSSKLNETGARHVSAQKAFASLMAVADHDIEMTNNVNKKKPPIPPFWQQERILETFQATMVHVWQEGYNIVYGNEEFDRISYPKRRNSSEIFDTVLDILPWETTIEKVFSRSNDTAARASLRPNLTIHDMDCVIVYRSPRTKHLKSLWHEVAEEEKNQTFQDFLTCQVPDTYHCMRGHVHVIDPLALAWEFVSRGVRTTVVDMEGIEAIANSEKATMWEKTNLCHVVACGVLRDEECSTDFKLQSMIDRTANITNEHTMQYVDVSTQKFNQREDTRPVNLTTNQWDAIENALQEYDCGWKSALTSSSLFRVLYQHSLFGRCSGNVVQERPLSWLIDTIEGIAKSSDW